MNKSKLSLHSPKSPIKSSLLAKKNSKGDNQKQKLTPRNSTPHQSSKNLKDKLVKKIQIENFIGLDIKCNIQIIETPKFNIPNKNTAFNFFSFGQHLNEAKENNSKLKQKSNTTIQTKNTKVKKQISKKNIR